MTARHLSRFKPAVSGKTRLLVASLVWSGVGTGLTVAGVRWLLGAPSAWAAAGISSALVLGFAKGRFVLARRAEANAERIVRAGEGRCLGGAFSWASWALVLVMMTGGMLLRWSPLPRPWLGVIYTAAGVALVLASGASWSHWRRAGPG